MINAVIPYLIRDPLPQMDTLTVAQYDKYVEKMTRQEIQNESAMIIHTLKVFG